MAKESRKQIVEQTRNEVAKQYKAKIDNLQERLNTANEKSSDYWKRYVKERNRADELQEKVNQYEDWIRRLQEFMDMPEDARKEVLEQERAKYEVNKRLDNMIGMYSRIFNFF